MQELLKDSALCAANRKDREWRKNGRQVERSATYKLLFAIHLLMAFVCHQLSKSLPFEIDFFGVDKFFFSMIFQSLWRFSIVCRYQDIWRMPHVPCHLSEIGQPETISLTINNRNHKSIEKLPNQIYFSQSIDIIQLSVGQKVESDHASISFVTEQHSHPTLLIQLLYAAVEILFFCSQMPFLCGMDGFVRMDICSWGKNCCVMNQLQ